MTVGPAAGVVVNLQVVRRIAPIELPAGDTSYVSARSGHGGPPLPGEWHGFNGEQTARPVAIGAGKIDEGSDSLARRMK